MRRLRPNPNRHSRRRRLPRHRRRRRRHHRRRRATCGRSATPLLARRRTPCALWLATCIAPTLPRVRRCAMSPRAGSSGPRTPAVTGVVCSQAKLASSGGSWTSASSLARAVRRHHRSYRRRLHPRRRPGRGHHHRCRRRRRCGRSRRRLRLCTRCLAPSLAWPLHPRRPHRDHHRSHGRAAPQHPSRRARRHRHRRARQQRRPRSRRRRRPPIPRRRRSPARWRPRLCPHPRMHTPSTSHSAAHRHHPSARSAKSPRRITLWWATLPLLRLCATRSVASSPA